ncbi:MAG: methyltransferase, partial [Ignavibacteriaceae bacterium]
PYWLDYPFSFQQIISWILLIYSGLLLIQSIYFFKKYGGSNRRRDKTENLEFENTANLVKVNIYRYIRHPMYGSLLFLSLGAFLKNISVLTILLSVLTIFFLILTAKVEEKENINFFGISYLEYMKETKMFVPFII